MIAKLLAHRCFNLEGSGAQTLVPPKVTKNQYCQNIHRAPQTHLWLIKVWFSASTFVLKIVTFAKPETVIGNLWGRC